jgi:protein subunit release factor A
MQVSLDQLLQMLMARLESLEMSVEDLKFRTNISLRMLRKNDDLDLEKVKQVVKEELEALNQLSEEEMDISEDRVDEIAKGIVQWVDNDLEELKDRLSDYQEKLKQLLEEEEAGKNISIASPELLKQLEKTNLNKIRGKNGGNKDNIIVP